MSKNILVLGSGAREHAIASKFQADDRDACIYVIPGNEGIDKEFFVNTAQSFDEIYDFIQKKKINLVFVGNEQFLADGIVDFLQEKAKSPSVSSSEDWQKFKVIGPTKEAARIESSKVFSKNLMDKYGVPTAFYQVFQDANQAIDFIRGQRFPLVLKADGLAAGKGVLIAENKEEAEIFVKEILSGQKFGSAGSKVVIEEFLSGQEASVFAFCDGENFVSTIFAQDHKRAFDEDKGLNTGGMGAFAPVDKFSHLKNQVDKQVFEPVLKAMRDEGCAFTGVLYAGLMIGNHEQLISGDVEGLNPPLPPLAKGGSEVSLAKGGNNEPKISVIEFNCRLGDPETQVILPLLENDLYEICEAIWSQKIHKISLKWKKEYAVAVVLASKGYPEDFEKGHSILVNFDILRDEKLKLYFSGVQDVDGEIKTPEMLSKMFLHPGMQSSLLNEDDIPVIKWGREGKHRFLTRVGGYLHFRNNGGRVMSLVAIGDTLCKTIDYVYTKIDLIKSEILRYRKDIGKKGLIE